MINQENIPLASIVITTRNRCDELRRALKSCEILLDIPFEILVYDDASTDGTSDMIQNEFPEVHLICFPARRGYIANRNAGFRDGRGEVVISIDDDAEFTDPWTLSRVIRMFEENPRAAALALPFIEPRRGEENGVMTPVATGTRLRNFIGCAHALRRQIALDLGGYPEFLIHQGEERDLSIRLLNAGYEILYADTGVIIHHASPIRDWNRMNYYGFRNTLLFSWMRLPFPECVFKMAWDAGKLTAYKFKWRQLPLKLQAIGAGLALSVGHIFDREPVSRSTYRRYCKLPKHGSLPVHMEISGQAVAATLS